MWPERRDAKGAIRTVAMPTDPGRATMPLRWAEGKAPGDLLPYFFDISAYLTNFGDSITSFTAAVAPNGTGDVAILAQGFQAFGLISVTLGLGNPGTDYAVTFTVDTATLDRIVRTIWLACQYLSPEGLETPLASNAAIPAVAPPLTLVDGVVTIDPTLFDAFRLAQLNSYPVDRPTSGWWNNGGVAEYVYPSA
jgi:hypothetical protein